MVNIALFASGSGTNAENIAKYFENDKGVKIVLILSNKADAFVHERAKKMKIDSVFFSKSDMENTDKVLQILENRRVDFIVLAGFLLKIPTNILERYPQRVINIHPALLPKYGGKGMYGDSVHKAVVNAGEHQTGITIHYVNEHYDEGDIIFQATCELALSDTYEDVARKVHALEYEHFPRVIEQLVQ